MHTLGQITERAALKAEVLAKFIDAIPVAFIVSDDKGKIYLVNRQTELLFGYDQTELIGLPVEVLLPESLREIHEKHRTDYVDEPYIRAMGLGQQLSGRKKNGMVFLADISLGPMVTTDGLYIVIAVVRHREEGDRA
ncbi:MAG TPA: PAS domain S-box protein [Terriglobales bacterium]|nr:PAS domain S-box protein [Terriglobales bacterium]